MHQHKPILFSTTPYQYMFESLLASSKFEKGVIVKKQFPDNEWYHRIDTPVEGRKVVLLGGTIDDASTLELYDMAQGLVYNGAASLHIVIPYFGYATMERAVQPGEIVKAKNRALLLSAIPMCDKATHVYLMDLHSEGIPYYFENDIKTSHVYCKQLFIDLVTSMSNDNVVLAATDAGRAKWVESLANEMHVNSAFVYKKRLDENETAITGINAEVSGKKVIIYDDMIRTGSSLMQAAAAYKQAGASEILAMTTHGLFNNACIEKIANQGIISRIFATNSHPNALHSQHELLSVIPIEKVIELALNL